ncbi:MAG: hypothetical protein HMLKMBBP_01869 [Planctomycetes bacterium]|nr:hypothetical protein [Planctomycetota bacterium]
MIRLHADSASFLAAAEPLFAPREAFFQLPLSVARQCVADPKRFGGAVFHATLEQGGGVTGAAIMTSPYRVQYYGPAGRDAVDATIDALLAGGWSVPGVHGPEDAAAAFAARWSERTGALVRRDRRLRGFDLVSVTPWPPTSGAMRKATAADEDVVARFYRGFVDDAHATGGALSPEETGRRALREGRVRLWDDGGPVTQAVDAGRLPNGVRVGAVYTPPEFRRRGYATALVGAMSRQFLEEGARYCTLFTDLANPVSNSIYPKVGYRATADYADWDFLPA